MQDDLIVFGAAYSAYTRIVRLVLAEKDIAHRFEEIDFIAEGPDAARQAGHPFGRVPILVHGERRLFETSAITLYLDWMWPSPALIPANAFAAAQMASAVSALDHYVWPSIRELCTQRLFAPLASGWPDEQVIERMVKRLQTDLSAFEDAYCEDLFTRTKVTLADLHALPMVAYLMMTPEGATLMARHPRLSDWWAWIAARPSIAATDFDLASYP